MKTPNLSTEEVSAYYSIKWDTYATVGNLIFMVSPFTKNYRVLKGDKLLYTGVSLDHAVEIFNQNK